LAARSPSTLSTARGEPLAEREHAAEQLQHRGDVLQQPHRGQRHPARSGREHHQGDHGDQPGADQQQRLPRRVLGEVPAAGQLEPHQRHGRGRRQQQRLGGQPGHCTDVHADPVLDQAVDPERDRQGERDPRQPPVRGGQDGHRCRADPDRGPLPRAQPLAQHHHPEQHGDQRVGEVAQARLDHVARVHRVDVGAPVHCQEHRRDAELHGAPAR